jgi:cysteine-rich repeat protein
VCGNSIVEGGEQCDDGNLNNGDGCSSICKIEAICGDAVVEPPEQCDDGNTSGGDGCSASCMIE